MAKILMIDDDPDIVLAVRIPLESCGHQFFSARSGNFQNPHHIRPLPFL